jgi:hypothetical protein
VVHAQASTRIITSNNFRTMPFLNIYLLLDSIMMIAMPDEENIREVLDESKLLQLFAV